MTVTHSIDAGELLGELQDDGDDDRLAVVRGAEEFGDGHFLFHGHPHPFFPHLLDVLAHVFAAAQTHQSCREEAHEQRGSKYNIDANVIHGKALGACYMMEVL